MLDARCSPAPTHLLTTRRKSRPIFHNRISNRAKKRSVGKRGDSWIPIVLEVLDQGLKVCAGYGNVLEVDYVEVK